MQSSAFTHNVVCIEAVFSFTAENIDTEKTAGCLSWGVIGVLCMQIDAAFLAKSSLEHEWPDIQQNAIECFYSLEYIEAVFSFTEEIIDKVKYLGCLL